MGLLPSSASLATVAKSLENHRGQVLSSITLACQIEAISRIAARRVDRLSALLEQCGVRVRLVVHRHAVRGPHWPKCLVN